MREEKLSEYKALLLQSAASSDPDHASWKALEALWDNLSQMEQDYLWSYIECREQGCNDKLADMLARQSPPYAKSDSTFLHGHDNGSQFQDTPWRGDFLKRVAE